MPVSRTAFVVGCPRSGTTLLQQLLNAHPAVSIGPETHFVRRYWLRRHTYGDLSTERCWNSLVRDVAAMPELGDMGITLDQVVTAGADLERHPKHLLGLLLELFANGAPVAGEKTPNHLLHMPLLQEWFPNALFLHVVRDPRAVVNSWRTVPWSTGTVHGDATVWRGQMETALLRPPGEGRLLAVRYEHLVGEPEGELRRICGFLGVPYDANVLQHHRVAPVGFDAEREPWKTNAAKPIFRASLDKWQEELSRSEIFRVEAAAGRLLEEMGYSPATPLLPRLLAGPALRWLTRGRQWLKEHRKRVS